MDVQHVRHTEEVLASLGFDVRRAGDRPGGLEDLLGGKFDYGSLGTPSTIIGATEFENRYGRERWRSSSIISFLPDV